MGNEDNGGDYIRGPDASRPVETMGVPPVRYAKSGSAHIAYQVFGEGPIELVMAPGGVSHLEVYWKNPGLVAFIWNFAEFK